MKSDALIALEAAAWPAMWIDSNGEIRRANQSAMSIFGLGAELNRPMFSTLWLPSNTGTVEEFFAKLNRQSPATIDLILRQKAGIAATFHVLISQFKPESDKEFLLQFFRTTDPITPQSFTTQVSILKADTPADSVVLQKQKLDCALQLARSVSLDFNNALTTILGHTSMLLSKIDPQHPWRNALIEVEKSAEKAAEIAQDLADFSRQEKDHRSVSHGNLNEVLRRTVTLFQSPAARPPVTWDLHLENRPYTVSFDEAKIQQALVKILENSIQAVSVGGVIRIQSRNIEVREAIMNGSSQVPPGYYVCIEVTDNGSGIAVADLPRVFEPFFTTKPKHRGLGLAWVYGIVTNHGGSVGIQSDPGFGTTVKIFLPAQNKFVRDSDLKLDELFGVQTILMVDDEEMLLTMAEMILPAFGYRVLTANSGPKALEILRANLGQIDLVISDMVMPQMSGRELIERIKQLAPEIRILSTSGYVRPGNQENDLYLQKPFTSQSLLRKVKEALS